MRAHRMWLSRAGVAGCFALGLVAAAAPPAGASHNAAGNAPIGCASIGIGAVGPAVERIQHAVGTSVDGDFGPATRTAVRHWQKAHSLPVTGVVDAATWAGLPSRVAQRACARPISGSGVTVSCPAFGSGAHGLAVVVAQRALGVAADGQFGEATAEALRAVQQQAGIAVTGVTDHRTWRALHLRGTPACSTKKTVAGQTKDERRQARIRAQVQQLAATLEGKPGETTNAIALQAVAFAKKQIGKPYVYGGVGPKGYDCSGLQMTAYRHAGLTLPRVAAAQYADGGTPKPLDQAKQGDLLFFASDVSKPATVYHVAMYVGHGKVLEAPHTGADVEVVPLWTTDLLPVVVRPVAGLALPLRQGDAGWSVSQLQQALNRHGESLTVDGGFGTATDRAVRAWQRTHELRPNGVVHTSTWLTLG